MVNKILPGQTIGIVGAGQLGKMLGQSALKQGYQVAMYDPNPRSCGFSLCKWFIVGSFDDKQLLLDFVKRVDVVTYEFENINAEILETIASEGDLVQGTELLFTSQDRVKEKTRLRELDIPIVDFVVIKTKEDLLAGTKQIGYPCVLKTSRLGYDGKGQCVLQSAADLVNQSAQLEILCKDTCVLEAFCHFEKEISVMVSRDQYGAISVYPIAQNQHINGILFSTFAPANVSPLVSKQVDLIARKIAEHFKLVGVLGIEFFVTEQDNVMVNELAPRPHNSGHYTIEACNFSQFDSHIIAITGRRLPLIKQLSSAFMINILGQHLSDNQFLDSFHQYQIHLYDKGEAKHQRKMGHMTLLADNFEAEMNSAKVIEWKNKFKLDQ